MIYLLDILFFHDTHNILYLINNFCVDVSCEKRLAPT